MKIIAVGNSFYGDDGVGAAVLERIRRATREEGVERVLAEHNLDALIAPTNGPAWMTDLVNGDHFGGGSSSRGSRPGLSSDSRMSRSVAKISCFATALRISGLTLPLFTCR